jgi:hypothetical protein
MKYFRKYAERRLKVWMTLLTSMSPWLILQGVRRWGAAGVRRPLHVAVRSRGGPSGSAAFVVALYSSLFFGHFVLIFILVFVSRHPRAHN